LHPCKGIACSAKAGKLRVQLRKTGLCITGSVGSHFFFSFFMGRVSPQLPMKNTPGNFGSFLVGLFIPV
jgi:hypothetical protein